MVKPQDCMIITYKFQKFDGTWVDGTMNVSKSKFYGMRNIHRTTTEETAKAYVRGQHKAKDIQIISVV